MYTYTENNPIMRIDPSGYCSLDIQSETGYNDNQNLKICGGNLVILAGVAIQAGGEIYRENEVELLAIAIFTKTAAARMSLIIYMEIKSMRNNEVGTHDHHIIAKASKYAKPARDVLIQSGLTTEVRINKVRIQIKYHRYLHNWMYYSIVNELMVSAYNSSMNPLIRNAVVEETLEMLNAWLKRSFG